MAEMLNNYVKFLRGTPTAYETLKVKDKDTLYFITSPNQTVGKLYLGDILVAGNVTSDGTSVLDSLAELTDVNLQGLVTGQVLGYNGTEWVPMNLPEAFEASIMVGASANKEGSAGYVPAPKAGDQNKFLRGDGTWARVNTNQDDYKITSGLFEDTLVDYRENEIRVMFTESSPFTLQQVGTNGNPNMYYMGFKAYAPEGATHFKEDTAEIIKDNTLHDFNGPFSGIDADGRKYSVCWLAVATYDADNDTWSYFGDKSTIDKYVGWFYSVEWYKDDVLIKSDTIRINLANKECYGAIKPYYMSEYATKAQLAEKADVTSVYTKTEADVKISEAVVSKADLSAVYTKEEADLKIANAVADKAIAAEVYTKSETDKKIGEAIAAADHLKRTVVDSIEDIDINAEDAEQYIYMVPVGTTEDDNKYREYIVIVTDDYRYIEQVGNWEVNLDGYLTKEDAKNTYANKSEVDAALNNRYTKNEIVDLLSNKVDVNVATSENGIRFINQAEITKLSKLSLEGDDVTISGSINASQVKELYPTVVNIIKGSASDLDPDSEGDQFGLGIEVGAQVNKIDTVSDDFNITESKELQLTKVPVGKLEGLGSEFKIENNQLILVSVDASKIVGLEENYLSKEDYEAELGDYSTLLHISGKENASVIEEVNALIDAMTWTIMTE